MVVADASNITIRDSILEDVPAIYELRKDPRLGGMQYPPSALEKPSAVVEASRLFPVIVPNAIKSTTILLNDQFAGHITEICTSTWGRQLNVALGWNLLPELWGHGIMHRALSQLFDKRFSTTDNINFIACCFASNTRCVRVIAKLGFKRVRLGPLEFLEHRLKTRGTQKVIKHRLSREAWREHLLMLESLTSQCSR